MYVLYVRQVQYAACLCLLLQLELMITGVVSSIVDIPTCKTLSRVFRGYACVCMYVCMYVCTRQDRASSIHTLP